MAQAVVCRHVCACDDRCRRPRVGYPDAARGGRWVAGVGRSGRRVDEPQPRERLRPSEVPRDRPENRGEVEDAAFQRLEGGGVDVWRPEMAIVQSQGLLRAQRYDKIKAYASEHVR